jgi:opacity protein-like surface antigen
MKTFAIPLVLFVLIGLASAQDSGQTGTSGTQSTTQKATQNTAPYMFPRNGISLGAGFNTTTGDPGFNSVNAFAGFRHRAFEIAAEFNHGSTQVKVPNLTVHINQEDYLFGPRFYFSQVLSNKKFVPFVNVLFGVAHENARIPHVSENSDNSYAWNAGGGVEYHFNANWGLRGRAGVLRTHFLDDSQTHARYSLGVLYEFAH